MIRCTGLRATLLTTAVVALSASVHGDPVVIATTTIQGSVTIGGLPISTIYVYASSPGLTTSSYSRGFGVPLPTTAPYTMTVGFPQGTSPTYAVRPEVYTDSGRDYLRLEPLPVTVNEDNAATLDFDLPTPGYVRALITVNDGGTLNSASIYAYRGAWWAQTSASAVYGHTFPVVPATGITVYGSVSVTKDGYTSSVSLPNRSVDVAAGQTVDVLYSITPPPPPPPPGTGSIAGTISFDGDHPVQQAYVSASGPTFRSQNQNPFSSGTYSLDTLQAGTYSMSSSVRMNAFDDYFVFPVSSFAPSRTVSVGTDPVTVNIAAQQSYISGAVRLGGLPSANMPTFNGSGYVPASSGGPSTSGGSAEDRLNTTTGEFDLIVSPGDWSVRQFSVPLFRGNPYLNQVSFQYYDYRSSRIISTTAGNATNADFDLVLGEVALRVSLAGGGVLSQPRIYGYCYGRDGNGTYLWYYYFDSRSNQVNVTEGRVSFVGPSGDCTVNGTVVVNGATLGIPTQSLHVIGGVSQDIDAGGPSLTLNTPAPGTYVSSNSLAVSGTASDDTAVASVKVNGVTATLSSTANPNDPVEVSFSATITLPQRGPNQITTIATDVANPAKTTTDTRTVYWDDGPPTLTFTPADGTSTPSVSAVVSGTADDDAGIGRIQVNGADVTFASTGNPARPREVSFSTSLPLAEGANTITVSVTDISNRVTTRSHQVTRESQVATTLTASNATGTYGGTTTLMARLLETGTGSPIGGGTVQFSVFGDTVAAQTDADGYARVAAFALGTNPVGTHTVLASFEGNAQAQASNGSSVLTISKATATLTLGGLSHTYDGTAKSATVSTVPVGLAGVAITYDGNSTPPTNAGQYAVVASLVNTNYEAPNAAAVLTIAKAPATVALGNLTHLHDGTAKQATVTTSPAGLNVAVAYSSGGSATTPINPGIYAVSAVVTELNYEGGATGVLVINAPPAITSITGPTGPIALGNAAMITAAFSDAATGDSHTCTFDWDDESQTGPDAATGGACSTSHTFATAGVYEVAVTVTDDDGLSGTGTFQYVVVYDPNAGFVTGGGWITSAPGSYVADPGLTGKATFGFVSKYQRGRTVPTGETQFQFEVAGFRFHSVSYEWLVVSGARAQYKGQGTVNGAGDYGFLLTATDGALTGGGGVDKFRIKIWDRASGTVVYDNVLGSPDDIDAASPQALGGGSIVVHSK